MFVGVFRVVFGQLPRVPNIPLSLPQGVRLKLLVSAILEHTRTDDLNKYSNFTFFLGPLRTLLVVAITPVRSAITHLLGVYRTGAAVQAHHEYSQQNELNKDVATDAPRHPPEHEESYANYQRGPDR